MAEDDFRARLASEYPWISLDLLFAALLAVLFLGYPQYDQRMQLVLRGLLLAVIWLFLISSWHLQVVIRHYESQPSNSNIPWYQSLFFALLRLGVVSFFSTWAIRRGFLV